MSTWITLCINGPTAGDYDRIGCDSLAEAFDAHANLDIRRLAHSTIEVQHNDFVHVIDPTRGVYRAPGDTPC